MQLLALRVMLRQQLSKCQIRSTAASSDTGLASSDLPRKSRTSFALATTSPQNSSLSDLDMTKSMAFAKGPESKCEEVAGLGMLATFRWLFVK